MILPGILSNRNESLCSYKHLYTNIHSNSSFVIIENLKQPLYPSTGEWWTNWCVHTMQYSFFSMAGSEKAVSLGIHCPQQLYIWSRAWQDQQRARLYWPRAKVLSTLASSHHFDSNLKPCPFWGGNHSKVIFFPLSSNITWYLGSSEINQGSIWNYFYNFSLFLKKSVKYFKNAEYRKNILHHDYPWTQHLTLWNLNILPYLIHIYHK